MACGTGKTLTGQRIAEQLGSNTTLVLLPSLLLLSKTISDWLTEAKQDFIFLPVCSDSSVTKKIDDQIQTSTSEMGFKTTTDAGEIATFLKRSENKVIFLVESGYTSTSRVCVCFFCRSPSPETKQKKKWPFSIFRFVF